MSANDYEVLSDRSKGLALAVSSSVFIGASFIVKKKGLREAGRTGIRAGNGGYSYLSKPLWWAGMLTMVVGEVANFAAYAFAPAILVTPLGALSIIVSAVLAHYLLSEKLNIFGLLGCALCLSGALTVVLHAPKERPITSLLQVWQLALQPGFILYVVTALAVTIYLMTYVAPVHGTTSIYVYITICSLMGSLSVMSCKALGISLKLTFEGDNQFGHPQLYFCILVVGVCVVTQMNYLNKALDLFNTAIVSPIYYVMFTTFTIIASVILFQEAQSTRQILTEACGFITIVIGTFLLHSTKDLDVSLASLSGMTKSASEKSTSFSDVDPEVHMQRLPLTATGTIDTPVGHRMTNSDRYS